MNLGLLDSESGLHWGRQLALCQPQLHADFEGVAFGTLNSLSFPIQGSATVLKSWRWRFGSDCPAGLLDMFWMFRKEK